MISAREDGWDALRGTVFRRDGMCLSKRADVFGPDVATDQCRDWQGFFITDDYLTAMEFEHVKEKIGGPKAADDEAHGVTGCPWHHRLSPTWRLDSKEHRAQVRAHLRKLYPEVWGATA